MGVVMFYHLTRSAPADTLAALLPRALTQGWRVLVRGTDAASLDRLDADLWLRGGDDGFLPHGREGGHQDADQPILLGQGPAANGAQALALIDGAMAEDSVAPRWPSKEGGRPANPGYCGHVDQRPLWRSLADFRHPGRSDPRCGRAARLWSRWGPEDLA